MDRADKTYDMHHLWTGQDFGDLKPSDVFRRNFLTCFITDPTGVILRHEIGIDNICWEMDYPHSDSNWPTAPEELSEVFVGVSDDDINRITHLNALNWFSYDPFAVFDRADCTVGALRAQAGDHDVSIRSRDTGRHGEAKDVSLKDFVDRAGQSEE
jgi:hypothetical protein